MEENNLTNCSSLVPIVLPQVRLAQQITVSIVCVLSVLGSSVIIFSYVAFKELRTGARLLLVQLSIADIVVALSHMFGVLVNLPKFVHADCSFREREGQTDLPCEIQAAVTMFGVIATFLWTLAIAVYLLVIIVFERKVIAKWLKVGFFFICWGLPLIQSIVFLTQHYLGFDDSIDIGWCYLTWINTTGTSQRRLLAPQVLGYSFWAYLTYLLLPLLYLWIRCYIRIKLTRVYKNSTSSSPVTSRLSDAKLTFIPLIFLVLRLPALAVSIPHMYLSYEDRVAFRGLWLNAVLVIVAGMGNSAQGLVNSILFCALTKVVRLRLIKSMRRFICCKDSTNERVYLLHPTPPASVNPENTSDDKERVWSTKVPLTQQNIPSNRDSRYQSINTP